jgi:hypothetical protein
MISGCGKSGPENILPVAGQVFVAGQPAAGATVTFYPVKKDDTSRFASATVDEKGVFPLTTVTAYDGAAPGEYRVAITWAERLGRDEGEDLYGPDKLQDRYANPDTSTLLVTVEPGKNNLQRFDLN